MVVSIVAGGWSVFGDCWVLRSIPGYIIGVNDAAIHLPKVDCVVSMDRLWTENRWDWLCEKKYPAWLRVNALKNVLSRDMSWIHAFVCDHTRTEFSLDQQILNGTNSGMCAFNHAYKMMPEAILLFGFDMRPGPNNEQHWYPDHPWKSGQSTKTPTLKKWANEFHIAAGQCKRAGIQVVNCSSRSLITDFDRKSPAEVMQ